MRDRPYPVLPKRLKELPLQALLILDAMHADAVWEIITCKRKAQYHQFSDILLPNFLAWQKSEVSTTDHLA